MHPVDVKENGNEGTKKTATAMGANKQAKAKSAEAI